MNFITFDNVWFQFAFVSGVGVVGGLLVAVVMAGVSKRTSLPIVSKSASQLRSFSFIVCLILGMSFGLDALEISAHAKENVEKIFKVSIYALSTWGIVRVYDVAHDEVLAPWAERGDNKAIVDVLRTFVHLIIWVLGIISALNSAGYDVTAIMAGLGIGGLALALAAQDAVANVFGGVVIITQTPFKVGDLIEVGSTKGWVLNIGLRSTLIKSWLGHYITVPNKVFTGSNVTNIDARTHYAEDMRIALHHECSPEEVELALEVVREVLDGNDTLKPFKWVGVSAIADGCAEIEVWFCIRKFEGESDSFPNEYMKILGTKSAINLATLRAFEAKGIRLALPLERIVKGGGSTARTLLAGE